MSSLEQTQPMSPLAKAQVTTEYSVFAGLAMLVVILVMVLFLYLQNSTVEDVQYTHLLDLGQDIQHSFFVMSVMEPTFSKTLVLPEYVNNDNYSFQITANTLYLIQDDIEVILALPPVNGSITNKTFTVQTTHQGMEVLS